MTTVLAIAGMAALFVVFGLLRPGADREGGCRTCPEPEGSEACRSCPLLPDPEEWDEEAGAERR